VKYRISIAAMIVAGGVSTAAAQSAGSRAGGSMDECTITAYANDITRIVMLRLSNGFYSHKAYGEKGQFICDGEWSATYALNKQAAEILRNKGNDRAVIVDRSRVAGG
jgi:hypothetical protein